MDYEQLSMEQVALMEHMGTRGVSRIQAGLPAESH
ncbi:hypothetical protein SAOR_00995 [Salinisphaera orenii MK-B5]|uniref:Uncharacterized protein n=1 Tax=Salinisphaera orenii MK-B5 TaxID=856730 RepID=A0A423PYC8_9GAMM|nr:hypothetical protein SAOR_00995 [Salinisphaera orenii MK-B5]